MKIKEVVYSIGLSGFYFDDQRAIKAGAKEDGFAYRGVPLTTGFESVRQKGESISVIFILEDGQIAFGDCTAIQYSGAGGREALFRAKDFAENFDKVLSPFIKSVDWKSFKEASETIDDFQIEGRRLHPALRYGVSQAFLDVFSKFYRKTMTEIIAEEYNLPIIIKRVPIFAQSGDDRYTNVDKMIIKRVDVLPHALINNMETKLGWRGEKLIEYLGWLKERVKILGDENYKPIFHIDVYGTIGIAFQCDIEEIADYLGKLEEIAHPFHLRIEGPLDMESKELQIEYLSALRSSLKKKGVKVEIVADEWCNSFEDIRDFVKAGAVDMIQIKTPVLGSIHNSIEAAIYCKENSIGTYIGGSCNETDRSAQISVHVALATQADQILAKPGMGVDEGLMIVNNEMERTLQLLRSKVKNHV
ncbi:MAG TPA: methylaspartate ammonia-lyase [Dictyoglomaceae bacterium]|nr:methylaspartate ammonia-lyase [Dictyoglomaceae bacterium]HOL38941.1 methylaspartate ammonia-lyase [Dictyoglomaceae bacterium]HOP94871.1 methylaspartate ammonia-lyase [Dictyoglomaceae bacterium]HPP15642.1 methylaspartate ammonia-lyase [Dictyoglomaceae bacterium]HPU43824.1 methylaspartate ammonia-lyase [Dictyoglomaceae bacterium]